MSPILLELFRCMRTLASALAIGFVVFTAYGGDPATQGNSLGQRTAVPYVEPSYSKDPHWRTLSTNIFRLDGKTSITAREVESLRKLNNPTAAETNRIAGLSKLLKIQTEQMDKWKRERADIEIRYQIREKKN